ncbi:MAPEG family protein [Microvirga sp. VF16]|uniref:MAPEG family protein n=1 Tax=Microvirga sp. VF16 TaxID=2807101 RepID=UPI00193D648A|nr:MAPEG family protein [Microvirga sp. VF16]QRM27202.1 MAPEG family protein [Microvirga sp. VF16]
MSITAILLPVYVQVALTVLLLLWMGSSRLSSLRTGKVKVRDIALGERNWPTPILQVQNAYHNQFELPVLFYVLVVLALFTRKADMLFVVMSWMFVTSRLVHAAIHTTSNRVSLRFTVFVVGVLILVAMWVIFGIRVLAAETGV